MEEEQRDRDNCIESIDENELSHNLSAQLNINPEDDDDDDKHEFEEYEDDDEDEDFSFVCDGPLLSPISAEEAFKNGEIRPVFPLFDRDLLLADSGDHFPANPPVKNVFSTVAPPDEEISGPCCRWSEKSSPEIRSPERCKKSNSTGFSKLWRFKDLIHRSNSDGRDAFVFLNPPAPPRTAEEVKVKVNAEEKKKKLKKSESVLAHERYLRSKANDNGGRRRRQSYLPYRPELVGLFTNVNGGLTRNVHPF